MVEQGSCGNKIVKFLVVEQGPCGEQGGIGWEVTGGSHILWRSKVELHKVVSKREVVNGEFKL